MKKKTARQATRLGQRVMEYDFSTGVTGKYADRYWESAAQAKVKRPSKKPA